MENTEAKRKRRSRAEQEGRNFICDCGKTYFSQQALSVHKKSKHSDSLPPDELIKKKRGRPRLSTETKLGSQDDLSETVKIKACVKKQKRETCDEIFSEFLEEKEKEVISEKFSEVKKTIYSLRECINKYSERIDLNDFLTHDDFTVTEKPELIPNIFEFYIDEFMPKNQLGFDRRCEAGRVYEFFQWLRMKNYTEVEIALNM